MDTSFSTISHFIQTICQLSPDEPVDLEPLFDAADRASVPTINDPYKGLVNIYNVSHACRITRPKDDIGVDSTILFPLKTARLPAGIPSVAMCVDEFKVNWSLFTKGALDKLEDWSHIIAAGGSVVASLASVGKLGAPEEVMGVYETVYADADIDLFLYGLFTEDEINHKINDITEAYKAVLAPKTVVFIKRTMTTVTLWCQDRRPLQIIFDRYKDPAHVLSRFDIDVAACLFNGDQVWMTPAAVVSHLTQTVRFDGSHLTDCYEMRLVKYALRGFEVVVPGQPAVSGNLNRAGERYPFLRHLLAIQKKLSDMASDEEKQKYLSGLLDKSDDAYGRQGVFITWSATFSGPQS